MKKIGILRKEITAGEYNAALVQMQPGQKTSVSRKRILDSLQSFQDLYQLSSSEPVLAFSLPLSLKLNEFGFHPVHTWHAAQEQDILLLAAPSNTGETRISTPELRLKADQPDAMSPAGPWAGMLATLKQGFESMGFSVGGLNLYLDYAWEVSRQDHILPALFMAAGIAVNEIFCLGSVDLETISGMERFLSFPKSNNFSQAALLASVLGGIVFTEWKDPATFELVPSSLLQKDFQIIRLQLRVEGGKVQNFLDILHEDIQQIATLFQRGSLEDVFQEELSVKLLPLCQQIPDSLVTQILLLNRQFFLFREAQEALKWNRLLKFMELVKEANREFLRLVDQFFSQRVIERRTYQKIQQIFDLIFEYDVAASFWFTEETLEGILYVPKSRTESLYQSLKKLSFLKLLEVSALRNGPYFF